MYHVILLICFCFSFSMLHPLLDGLINPIILDTHYTFTPGEIAKGFVYFREGFDVPLNSTIFLRLAKGVLINGPIVLNEGTINLRASVQLGPTAEIIGDGFFLGANTVRVIVSDNLIIRDRLRFFGQCYLQGVGRSRILFVDNGCLDLSLSQLNTCFLVNLDLRLTKSDQIVTSATNTAKLNMINCFFSSGNGVITAIKNPILDARNCSFQTGKNGSLICSGSFLAQGLTSLESNSYLIAKNFDSGAAADEFRLNNSIMDIVSNVSGDVTFALNSVFEGRFAVYGRSILRSSNQNRILISKALRLEVSPGSRLIIDQGTAVKIL